MLPQKAVLVQAAQLSSRLAMGKQKGLSLPKDPGTADTLRQILELLPGGKLLLLLTDPHHAVVTRSLMYDGWAEVNNVDPATVDNLYGSDAANLRNRYEKHLEY